MRRSKIKPSNIEYVRYPMRIEIIDERDLYEDGNPKKVTQIEINNSWQALGLLEQARKAVEAHRKIAYDEWKRLDDALKETS